MASRINEFQWQINCILTKSSKNTHLNIIGTKSTEAALVHSENHGILSLNSTDFYLEVNVV